MKTDNYDEWKSSSPDYKEEELKELDLKFDVEIHRDKVDAFVSWVKENIINYDFIALQSPNQDEGLYCYLVYGAWKCYYNDSFDKALEIRDIEFVLVDNLGCEYAEVEENTGETKVKEFLNLPKQKTTPLKRMLRLIKSIKSDLVIDESDEVYESGNCCNKQTFNSEIEALSSIGNYRKKSKRPFRAYKCESGKWHLSGIKKSVFNKNNT